MSVIVYSKPNCPQCVLTKNELERLNIEFDVIDVSTDTDAVSHLKQMGFRALPVVKANGEYWSGHKSDKLKSIQVQ